MSENGDFNDSALFDGSDGKTWSAALPVSVNIADSVPPANSIRPFQISAALAASISVNQSSFLKATAVAIEFESLREVRQGQGAGGLVSISLALVISAFVILILIILIRRRHSIRVTENGSSEIEMPLDADLCHPQRMYGHVYQSPFDAVSSDDFRVSSDEICHLTWMELQRNIAE
jgi:hypothetical protein